MKTYSHTSLATFRHCPRQFYYRYRAKVSRDHEQTIEAFVGSLVHRALEALYRRMLWGKRLTVDQLVGHFHAAWERDYHDGIAVIRPQYAPDDYRQVGADCLRRYYARHAPFDQTRTVALENRVSVTLDDDGRYRLRGIVDRLSRADDDGWQVHDYKTTAHLPSQAEIASDTQLALYAIGIRQRWPDAKQIELIWHFLRQDIELRSIPTIDRLDKVREDAIRLINQIESRRAESDFRPEKSALCAWCPFQSRCPVHKHLFKARTLPADRFVSEPGVRLVDRHAELTAEIGRLERRISEMDDEREAVKTALIAYAEREGLSTVVGTAYEATVRSARKTVLPRKTQEPEDHRELDERLRHSEVWPMVSAIDPAKLRRIWTGDERDPGSIRPLIEPFVRETVKVDVRLRKRSDSDAKE